MHGSGAGWGDAASDLLGRSHLAKGRVLFCVLEKAELSVAPREELFSIPWGRAPPIRKGFPSR